jgi:GNAT superfamily N-acetyltransferase
MTQNDVEEVREVGQIAWSDLAMHDIGRKFKYPKRSEKIIDAYLWKDPNGCLVVEEDSKIVGSAFCHAWGKVGWIGPLEVLPSHQDHGIGRLLLKACEEHLNDIGCTVIGLETMSHLPKQLHFYMSSGYKPGATTLIVEKVLRHEPTTEQPVEELTVDNLEEKLPLVAEVSGKVNPQLDYSREVETIVRKRLGHVYLTKEQNSITSFALLHTYQRGEEATYSSVKALLIDPSWSNPQSATAALLSKCEHTSMDQGKSRLLTRFSAGDLKLYELMLARSYVLKGANLRMIKKGEYTEQGSYCITSWAG